MKCCSKSAVGLAVVAGLGIAILAATGWGEVIVNRVKNKIQKQVPPEAQLEKVKLKIGKLDNDIDKGWEPIAAHEREIRQLKSELERKQAKVKAMDKELAAAADELEAKKNQITYNGRQYSRGDANRLLSNEANYFTSLKREIDSRVKQLAALEEQLKAAHANQREMASMKDELIAKVAKIEADLAVLKAARTKSKLPTGDKSRLDEIKSTLQDLENQTEDQMRALDLRNKFHRGEDASVKETKENVDTTDAVVRKVRKAIGEVEEKVAKDE